LNVKVELSAVMEDQRQIKHHTKREYQAVQEMDVSRLAIIV